MIQSIRCLQQVNSIRSVYRKTQQLYLQSATYQNPVKNRDMGLLDKLRPFSTYTNATTEVIDVPEGGKVRAIVIQMD